jgi:putative MFS transporter
MGYTEDFTVDTLLNVFLLIGALGGLWFMEKYSRRGFTIGSFAFLAISLFLLSVVHNHILATIFFVLFTFMMSAASNLTLVYPAELFPTELRASGVGMVTAISRVGSAIGTFLLPVTMNSLGFTPSMIGLAVVLLIGTLVSMAWAPETKDLTLNDASNPDADSEHKLNSLNETVNTGS